jgi:CBS domain-containing protein
MTNNPYKMTVRDVMVKDLVSILPDDTVHDCIQRMVENRVPSLPVLGPHNECLGIVSTSDLIEVTRDIDDDLVNLERSDLMTGRWLLQRLMDGIGYSKVQEIMSVDVATVSADTPLARAAREMLRNNVHRLPVVDVKERVIGIVSTTDILSAFVDGDPHG